MGNSGNNGSASNGTHIALAMGQSQIHILAAAEEEAEIA